MARQSFSGLIDLTPALLLTVPLALISPVQAEETPVEPTTTVIEIPIEPVAYTDPAPLEPVTTTTDMPIEPIAETDPTPGEPVLITAPICDPATADCDPDFDDPLSLVPHRFDFGRISPNATSEPQVFALSNDADANITIGTVAVSGDGIMVCQAIGCPVVAPTAFLIQSDACSGVTLTPASSCEIEVLFSPASGGAMTAALRVPYQLADGTAQELNGKLLGSGDSGLNNLAIAGKIYQRAKKGGAKAITPLAGIEVRLSNDMLATTDEFGEYRFENLPPGRYTVTPVSEDYKLRPRSRAAVLKKKDRDGLDFEAKAQ